MNNQKGVTLASLTIYVIVAAVVVIILAFLNANFFSQMSDLTNKTDVTNEYAKFTSLFIKDLKSSDTVLEYNQNEIQFSNGAKYEIRKLEGTNEDEEEYVIFRNSEKICDNVIGKYVELQDVAGEYVDTPYFDYDHLENTVTAILVFSNRENYEFEMQQVFKLAE